MSKLKKLISTLFGITLCFAAIAQQNCVPPNPVAHIILIPAGLPKLDGQPLPVGSIIAAVFNSGDTLRCAGEITWQNKAAILQAYGKTPEGDAGFAENEPLKFRIILPNGCTIEDDLISTKFQGIENNQNPGFQNLALARLEQFDAKSPQFNVQLPAKDTISCQNNQIEINPQVDVLGAIFEWSTDSLGVISRKSKLIAEFGEIFTLKVSLKGCQKTQQIEVIDLRNELTVDISPSEPKICEGESLKIEAFTNLKIVGFIWNTGSKTNNINITKAGRYTLTVSTEHGCSVEKIVEVTQSSKPTLDLGDDIQFCVGDSIELSAPKEDKYKYRWSNGDTTFHLKIKKEGTYTLLLTNSENCSTMDSVKVKVSPFPTLSIPPLIKMCEGKSITISPISDALFFRWNTGDTTSTITVNKAGGLQVSVRNIAGCDATATTEVVTITAPSSNLSPEINRCTTESVELDPGVANANYEWNSGQTTQKISPVQSGLYIVKITLGEGCSVVDSTMVNFLPTPKAELGNNQVLCQGQVASLQVKDTVAFRYRWSTGDKLASIQTTKSGLYTVTVSNAANCQTIDSVFIAFFESPPRLLPDTLISCENTLAKLVAGTDSLSYLWNTGENDALIIPEKTGYASVKITNPKGCVTFDSTYVAIVPSPALTLADTLVLCKESTITLDASRALGPNFLWSTGATTGKIEVNRPGNYSINVSNVYGCEISDSIKVIAQAPVIRNWPNPISSCEGQVLTIDASKLGQIISWNTGQNTPSIQIRTSGLYSVSFLDKSACKVSDSLRVVFNKAPVLNLPDSIRICQGASKILDVSNSGKMYEWNTGARTGLITVKDAQLFRVVVTNEFGCQSKDSTRLLLWANPLVNLPKSDTICPGENLALDVRAAGQKFKWSTGATTGMITTSNAGLYGVTVTDGNGCIGQGTTQVIGLNLPIASIDKNANFLCLGDSMILRGTGGSPLKWIDPNNTSLQIAKDRISIKPKSKATYGFVAENFCGTDTAFVQIEVRKVNGSAGKDTAILLGRTLKLQARGGKTYQWTSPDYQIANSNVANPEVVPLDSTYFVVTIEDENKCVLKDTVFIGVYSDIQELIKPINLFTPNGDGKNDVLKFKDLNLFKTNKIKVFNRWGGIVFQQSNYQNDWNGTYNGSPLPAGVYYYVLELDEAVLKSSLTLIRN